MGDGAFGLRGVKCRDQLVAALERASGGRCPDPFRDQQIPPDVLQARDQPAKQIFKAAQLIEDPVVAPNRAIGQRRTQPPEFATLPLEVRFRSLQGRCRIAVEIRNLVGPSRLELCRETVDCRVQRRVPTVQFDILMSHLARYAGATPPTQGRAFPEEQ